MIHRIYKLLGMIFCNICLIWWRIRDKINPPNTDAVLFVAHPDDDTLFFHTFIKKHHPYVCLMTTGWSLRRLPCFIKVMKYYGVRYRVYTLRTNDPRMHLHEKQVQEVLRIGRFNTVATHNSTGEYGHEEHQRVHNAVMAVLSEVETAKLILCPEDKSCITNYPLPEADVEEKKFIFKSMYTTEAWVLDEDTEWVINEHLKREYV